MEGNSLKRLCQVDVSGQSIVECLVQPISGSCRNVTLDNWYTVMLLSESQLKQHNLTHINDEKYKHDIFSCLWRDKVQTTVYQFVNFP